ASRSEPAWKILRPILDIMQTMPIFVYLLPALMLFGIGLAPAVIATVVFASPPAIRLTNLGIRQVPQEVMEAALAFGSTPMQILTRVQLPLALPSILAGVNQCIMLSLSMVVISAMIGAGGLGGVVYRAISRVEIGSGFEGGIGVVVIAIILDRITQSLGRGPVGKEQG
ncbi:MAG: ABC transporter permease, partial [Dethiobacteria bacterium]